VLVHAQQQILSKLDANAMRAELHSSPFRSVCFFLWLSMRAIWKLKNTELAWELVARALLLVYSAPNVFVVVRTESGAHTFISSRIQ